MQIVNQKVSIFEWGKTTSTAILIVYQHVSFGVHLVNDQGNVNTILSSTIDTPIQCLFVVFAW